MLFPYAVLFIVIAFWSSYIYSKRKVLQQQGIKAGMLLIGANAAGVVAVLTLCFTRYGSVASRMLPF